MDLTGELKRQEMVIRDREAETWERWYMESKGAFWSEAEMATVIRALAPKEGETILDAGCGTGRLTRRLAGTAKLVLALDFSSKSLGFLLARAREDRLHNVRAVLGDLGTPLPLPDASVDKVLASQVIQHIPSSDQREGAMKEFCRILRPGGRLVASAYKWGGTIRDIKEGCFTNGLYRYAFTPSELREQLQRAGFRRITVRGLINLPRLPEAWRVFLAVDRLLWHSPLSLVTGRYLIAWGEK